MNSSTPDEAPVPPTVITLDDLLKSLGVVGTGGQAKLLIQAGEVTVNGQTETRRRRKLRAGDVVEAAGVRHTVSESGANR